MSIRLRRDGLSGVVVAHKHVTGIARSLSPGQCNGDAVRSYRRSVDFSMEVLFEAVPEDHVETGSLDAEVERIPQAKRLLVAAGFVENADGTFTYSRKARRIAKLEARLARASVNGDDLIASASGTGPIHRGRADDRQSDRGHRPGPRWFLIVSAGAFFQKAEMQKATMVDTLNTIACVRPNDRNRQAIPINPTSPADTGKKFCAKERLSFTDISEHTTSRGIAMAKKEYG